MEPQTKYIKVKRWDERFVDYSAGSAPGPRRVKLTLEEAWQIGINIPLLTKELGISRKVFGSYFTHPSSYVLSEALGDGRVSILVGEDVLPTRVLDLLVGATRDLIFGCVKESNPPIFWVGEA